MSGAGFRDGEIRRGEMYKWGDLGSHDRSGSEYKRMRIWQIGGGGVTYPESHPSRKVISELRKRVRNILYNWHEQIPLFENPDLIFLGGKSEHFLNLLQMTGIIFVGVIKIGPFLGGGGKQFLAWAFLCKSTLINCCCIFVLGERGRPCAWLLQIAAKKSTVDVCNFTNVFAIKNFRRIDWNPRLDFCVIKVLLIMDGETNPEQAFNKYFSIRLLLQGGQIN